MADVSYISVKDLTSKLRDGASITIVDVREDDRAGGHIKSSVHVPAYDFSRAMSTFLPDWASKEAVVFHCMMSQVRGPTCARAFANAVDEALKKGDVAKVPQVLVLEGGFREFASNYSDDTHNFFEDFQPKRYEAGW